jgi:DNA-binding transcriptional LysR family regulator
MNLKALRVFRRVVTTGSLSAAARELNLSQSAASRLISLLESTTNLTLFNRTRRRLTLSTQGEVFFRETEHILAGIDEIPRIVDDIRSSSNEPFKVVTAPRIGQGLVAEALALMTKENPDVRCSVDIQSRFDLELKVGTRRYDLGIVSLPVSHSLVDIENRPLVRVRAEALLSKDHPLADRDSLTADDLAGERMMGLWPDQLWRQQTDDFFRSGGTAPNYVVETKSSLMACQFARFGAGITVLDRLCAQSIDLSNVALKPLEPARWISYGYIFQRGRTLMGPAEIFLECTRRTIETFRQASPENAASLVPYPPGSIEA